MEARLVWDTWRRILTDDALVERVLGEGDGGSAAAALDAAEMEILADYAATPIATDTNIGMYRRGLVRNALGALSLVPLTRHLLYMSDLDVEAVAEDYARSTGYVDDGPNFWRTAGGFVAYLARRPEFAAPLQQDVFALDAATVALARRLGEAPAALWPESAAAKVPERLARDGERLRLVANRAATVVRSRYDLTAWIEDPEQFDPDQAPEQVDCCWLVYFPAAEGPHAYAELSERAARAFELLAQPMEVASLAPAIPGLPPAETVDVVDSLAQLGVVVPAMGPAASGDAPPADRARGGAAAHA